MKPDHRRWLVMKTKHPLTGKMLYFIDKCLPFGSSISCAHFQSLSNALAHIVEVKTRTINPRLGNKITNYLDDFLFLSLIRALCNQQMEYFFEICELVGCPIALDKTEMASSMIIFLGMLLNG